MQEEKREFEDCLQQSGVIPEKYVDALMGEIMKDPVELPSSKQVVDRLTIVKHLLNDKTDPFNRDPLAEEQLIPLPELRAEIQFFLKQKRDQL